MSSHPIDVRHVAELARLALTDDEVAQFQPQLESILHHIESLTHLDVSGIEPTAHPVPIEGPLREDIPHESLPVAAVLANAPDQAGGQFRVPKVVADA